jgi:ketosteroid isomerase-like protein
MRTRNFSIKSLDVSDIKIKLISQHAAIVTSLAEVDGTNDGRPLHGSFRYTRVYQRIPNDGWKITSFEATHVPKNVTRADAEQPQAQDH